MMIDALSDKQRQLLAVAILALILFMVTTLTILPLWAVNRHYTNTIDELDTRLQILQRAVSASDGLRTQHDQLKRSLASNRHYLQGNSDALAAANLQSTVKRVALSRRMEVLSTQILPSKEEAGFTRVALKVRMRGTLDNTVQLMHSLETSQPYLFLDNVTIRSISRRRAGNAAGQMLNVDFDLIGYMLPQS